MTREYFAAAPPWLDVFTLLLWVFLLALALGVGAVVLPQIVRDTRDWIRDALRPEPPASAYGSEDFEHVEPHDHQEYLDARRRRELAAAAGRRVSR